MNAVVTPAPAATTTAPAAAAPAIVAPAIAAPATGAPAAPAAPATPAAPAPGTLVTPPPAPPAAPAPDPATPEGKAAIAAAEKATKDAAREVAIKAGVLEVAPEKYEAFTLPEGAKMDEKSLTAFQATAKDIGLSQAQAQRLVDTYAKDIVPGIFSAQQQAFDDVNKGWIDTAKADKEFGGAKFDENMAVAKKTLEKFGGPELVKALNDTRLGNHPELVRLFYRVGKAISEDSIAGNSGAGGGSNKDAASVLYDK